MKISELKPGVSNVSISAKVIDISEIREVQTRYGRRNVADATLEDDSGQISLTLWEDQIQKVSIGNIVNVIGGFVTSFRDKIQLGIPRSGKLEVVEG